MCSALQLLAADVRIRCLLLGASNLPQPGHGGGLGITVVASAVAFVALINWPCTLALVGNGTPPPGDFCPLLPQDAIRLKNQPFQTRQISSTALPTCATLHAPQPSSRLPASGTTAQLRSRFVPHTMVPLPLQPRLVLALTILLALCSATSADPRTSVAGQTCAPGTAVSGSALADNFVPAMDELNTNVSAHGFGTSAVGSGPNTVFGLGQCFRDLSPVDCKLCFAEVRSLLPKCYPRVGGRLYLDGCFGRYGNYSFFGEALDAASDARLCGTAAEGNYTGADPRAFGDAVRAVLANVTAAAEAPGSQGFGAGSAAVGGATAFAIAQCWETLNGTACAQCLRAASAAVAPCAPAAEGRALFAGCYLRYSTRQFWNVNATAGSSSSGTTIQIPKPHHFHLTLLTGSVGTVKFVKNHQLTDRFQITFALTRVFC